MQNEHSLLKPLDLKYLIDTHVFAKMEITKTQHYLNDPAAKYTLCGYALRTYIKNLDVIAEHSIISARNEFNYQIDKKVGDNFYDWSVYKISDSLENGKCWAMGSDEIDTMERNEFLALCEVANIKTGHMDIIDNIYCMGEDSPMPVNYFHDFLDELSLDDCILNRFSVFEKDGISYAKFNYSNWKEEFYAAS